jgi:AmmeMemoRadiSam system protein A
MPSLSEDQRQALLRLARESVTHAVAFDRLPAQIPTEGVFAEKRGVFVTLHVHDRLRGCIGVVEPDHPLGDSIVRCAAGAALHDPRFSPLQDQELGHTQIEISVLSPPFRIRPEEIELGRHGLLVVRGRQRGLLLPQVATQHHFTAEQFLIETCRKAQLPPDAWRDPGAEVFAFTCEVFSDSLLDRAEKNRPAPESGRA